MKIIKIVGQNGTFLLKSVEGELITLPKNSIDINKYYIDEELLSNDTKFFIDLSPDESNPLNFDGVIIGLKLYLDNIRKNNLKIEIHLFGFDTKEFVFQKCNYSFFLNCPNVNYHKIDFNNEWNLQKSINQIDKEEAIDRIKMIGIKPPTSYKTNHSIANEWAIYRWSRYLGINQTLSDEINNSLFFNYLRTIYDIEEVETKKNLLVTDGKILLIDDEEEKGWSPFFKNLRLPSIDKEKFSFIGKEFKSIENQNEIIKMVKDKIDTFDPELVILDLRLMDADFEESESRKLTGYKILELIKNEINKGIQVILFTASNKIWNFQSLSEIGFDGWIVKESPEQSYDKNYTKNAIIDLKKQMELGLNKAVFLKKVYKKIINIIDDIKKNEFFVDETDKREIFYSNLNIAFDLLEKASSSERHKKYYNYAYLQLYLCIEEFLKLKNVYTCNNDVCYVNKNIEVAIKKDTWKSNLKYIVKTETSPGFTSQSTEQFELTNSPIYNTEFKMAATLMFIFKYESSNVLNWPNIRDLRNNKVGHPGKKEITEIEINQIIDFIEVIFKKPS